MILYWLAQRNSRRLIIFCNGWGMDHHPFSLLDTNGFDVAVLSDYRGLELPFDMQGLAAEYEIIHLLGWSFGVWAAQSLFFRHRALFNQCVAINGTLKPINDRYGIPYQFFNATREQFSNSVLTRFYRRMCRPRQVLDLFLAHRPRRLLTDQGEELDGLYRLARSGDDQESIFDAAIISTKDLIIPTDNQRAFWKDRCSVIEVEGCHFPFSNWAGWSEIIDVAGRDGC